MNVLSYKHIANYHVLFYFRFYFGHWFHFWTLHADVMSIVASESRGAAPVVRTTGSLGNGRVTCILQDTTPNN